MQNHKLSAYPSAHRTGKKHTQTRFPFLSDLCFLLHSHFTFGIFYSFVFLSYDPTVAADLQQVFL